MRRVSPSVALRHKIASLMPGVPTNAPGTRSDAYAGWAKKVAAPDVFPSFPCRI